ncbi:MAG: CPBP family intramembrane metalloprotease [Proteobacteria bacterium]|nr:CPBP family intramembrane metalloprotease [Pseudomonadota bacterium]
MQIKQLIVALKIMGVSLLKVVIISMAIIICLSFFISSWSQTKIMSTEVIYSFDIKLSDKHITKIKKWYAENRSPVEINTVNAEVKAEYASWNDRKAFQERFYSMQNSGKPVYNILITEWSNNPLGASVEALPWEKLGLNKNIVGGLYFFRSSYSPEFFKTTLLLAPFAFFLVAYWSRKKLKPISPASNSGILYVAVVVLAIIWATIELSIFILIPELTEKVRQIDYYADYIPHKYAFAFFAIFIAPLCEEMFFRWYLLEMFIQRNFKFIGLVITSASFTGIHGVAGDFYFDFARLSLIFLTGIFLGLIYLKTRRLIYPVLFHATVNLVVIVHGFFIA